MREVFKSHPLLRNILLVAILIGSMIGAFFSRSDYIEGVPVIPVFGGVTGGCVPCVSFCGGDIAVACIVGPPRPGRVMVDPHFIPPGPQVLLRPPGVYNWYQLHDGVWWLGGGRPGGSCDIPAPHSGCIGFTITVTALYTGTSLTVGPWPVPL